METQESFYVYFWQSHSTTLEWLSHYTIVCAFSEAAFREILALIYAPTPLSLL